MSTTIQAKLEILADAAKYDASCASSGAPKRNSRGQGGHRLDHRRRHLPFLYARWPLRVAAENSADQLLHVRLRLLHQPALQQCPARPLHGRGSRHADAGILQAQLHRRPVPVVRHHRARPTTRWSRWSRWRGSCARCISFRGYIHLKAIPEASQELTAQAGRYADRLSINIELPTEKRPEGFRAGEAHHDDPQHDGRAEAAHRRKQGRDEARRSSRRRARARR